MAINTSWDRIIEPHGNIKFNVNVAAEGDPDDYYPMQITLDITPQTANGVKGQQQRITKNVGTNQATAFDFSTVQGLKDIHTALPSWARAAFKEGVVAVINEDPSV